MNYGDMCRKGLRRKGRGAAKLETVKRSQHMAHGRAYRKYLRVKRVGNGRRIR